MDNLVVDDSAPGRAIWQASSHFRLDYYKKGRQVAVSYKKNPFFTSFSTNVVFFFFQADFCYAIGDVMHWRETQASFMLPVFLAFSRPGHEQRVAMCLFFKAKQSFRSIENE